MNPTYTSDALPTKLAEHLDNAKMPLFFRRRAVLVKAAHRWVLFCCSVESIDRNGEMPIAETTHRYENAILIEDVLSLAQCHRFAMDLASGLAEFGGIILNRDVPVQWSTQLVPLDNEYMDRAGLVFGLRISQTGEHIAPEPLLSPDQPYYPGIEDAARDWLPFPVYHGYRDGRNGQIFFLLPETRAFVSDAKFPDDGTLEITVSGTLVYQAPLIVKGAYWEGATLHHFDASIENSMCRVVVPAHTDRLEYYLIGQDGTVFDFHREARFSSVSTGRKVLRSVQRSLGDQIKTALHDGEGRHTEFKPFIDPEQPLGTSTQKTKLRELVTTVVAFANARGGHVYIGVDDDCNPVGIDHQLAQWAKAPVNEVSVNRYLGALKSKIKTAVHGEVEVQLFDASFEGALIVIVKVPPAVQKPVTVQQDAHLYARTGASNRKVPPESWRTILDPETTGAFGQLDA